MLCILDWHYKSYDHFNTKQKKYAKVVARSGDLSKSLAIQTLKDPDAYPWLVKGIGTVVNYELQQLCSNHGSIQRSKEKGSVENFPWDDIAKEAVEHCPTLTSLLLASTTTKAQRTNRKYLFCAIMCMLSKYRRSCMSLFQRLVSVVLYSAHVGTTVHDSVQLCFILHILHNRLMIDFKS